MADYQTWAFWHGFNNGPWLGASAPPSGYLDPPAVLVQPDSREIIIDLYEDDESETMKKTDLSWASTVEMRINYLNSPDTDSEQIATGTKSTTDGDLEENQISFVVNKDDIPSKYVGRDDVLLIFRATSASGRRSLFWQVKLIDEHGDRSNNPGAADIAYSPNAPADWTDPDPAYVNTALDKLAANRARKTTSVDIEITDSSKGLIFADGSGNRRRLTVNNDGLVVVSDPL